MMENSDAKKSIFYMIVLILTLITMIVGATLAYFKLVDSQKEEGTVLYTGKLEINYIDGVYLKNPTLIPTVNPGYDTYEGVYRNTFSVVSSGTLDQTITLELELSRNEFSTNYIKFAVFNEKGQRITAGTVPDEGKVTLASNIFLKATGTAKYTLLIWLNDTGGNQTTEMGKSISGKINIHSKQVRY